MNNYFQSFFCIDAKHRNIIANNAFQTIMYMPMPVMLHVSCHWSERGLDDVVLPGLAAKHSAFINNRVPDRTNGLTPLDLLFKTKADHRGLLAIGETLY
eukprot:CCRYP_005767-RA/>CCRYP_005767-RA protein AED:0.10 eAED:-0.02 QI:0/-1/0/1/-1/1/1/0/98